MAPLKTTLTKFIREQTLSFSIVRNSSIICKNPEIYTIIDFKQLIFDFWGRPKAGLSIRIAFFVFSTRFSNFGQLPPITVDIFEQFLSTINFRQYLTILAIFQSIWENFQSNFIFRSNKPILNKKIFKHYIVNFTCREKNVTLPHSDTRARSILMDCPDTGEISKHYFLAPVKIYFNLSEHGSYVKIRLLLRLTYPVRHVQGDSNASTGWSNDRENYKSPDPNPRKNSWA